MKKLACAVQNYQWGKYGNESFVAKMFSKEIDPQKRYAELWMGTHPNGPSRIDGENLTLEEYIRLNPNLLGEKEEGNLKFLFKILSVDKALSIQVHPTIEQAMELHKSDPVNYPDGNHKPEMAIALTPFEMLCSFRVPQQIAENLNAYDELLDLFDRKDLVLLASECENNKEALQRIFTQVWSQPKDRIESAIRAIIAKIEKKPKKESIDELMLRLNSQFPCDVGILGPLFLNHFVLKPGEATFLEANEPHAYLSGDCIECMACSDNTIRAGLTPKFKDIQTLCKSLTYKMVQPPILHPQLSIIDNVITYAPSVSEFAVQKITNQPVVKPLETSSIMVMVSGVCKMVSSGNMIDAKQGDAIFLPRKTEVILEEVSESVTIFRAYTP